MKQILVCSLLLLMTSAVTSAQEQVIDELTYNNRMRTAGEYRLKENYRETRISESCRGNGCTWKPQSIDITEVDHPGKRRAYIVRADRGETGPSTEWIFIDEKIYVKRRGLDWQIEEEQKPSSLNQTSETIKIEYKDLGRERTQHEENKVLLKRIHSRLVINGEESANIQTIKSWIDKTGRLKKQEYLMTSSKIGSTRLTLLYEVDPNIKIAAPIK